VADAGVQALVNVDTAPWRVKKASIFCEMKRLMVEAAAR
jgi:hypothetical protein